MDKKMLSGRKKNTGTGMKAGYKINSCCVLLFFMTYTWSHLREAVCKEVMGLTAWQPGGGVMTEVILVYQTKVPLSAGQSARTAKKWVGKKVAQRVRPSEHFCICLRKETWDWHWLNYTWTLDVETMSKGQSVYLQCKWLPVYNLLIIR